MNVQKKFEKWSKDERFLRYVNERMREEITDVPENHLLDPQYEELDEGFDGHDEYIEPAGHIPYLQTATGQVTEEHT